MKCVICGKRYSGYGNNAEPLKEGRCCDECNIIVIQYRIAVLEGLVRAKEGKTWQNISALDAAKRQMTLSRKMAKQVK